MNSQDQIKELITKNKVFAFIKGTPTMPQCGFTVKTINILNELDVPYETFNVLEDEEMRQAIKDFTDWPTIPQVFINGEFIGGADIMTELFETGELQKLVK